MTRADWIREKRRRCEERMDTIFAPIYEREWGSRISPTHRRMMERFLSLLLKDARLLDAACGTGKYWPMMLGHELQVTGTDQSTQMLSIARSKHPSVSTRKIGLQELDYREEFDGVACIDAMENIFPEDWPRVLRNFHDALKPSRFLYFTIELADDGELTKAYRIATEQGLPVVEGEQPFLFDSRAGYVEEAGYHYYPSTEQVKKWLRETAFTTESEVTGDEYLHFIVRRD